MTDDTNPRAHAIGALAEMFASAVFRAGMDVKPYEGGNIQHQELLPMSAAWPPLRI